MSLTNNVASALNVDTPDLQISTRRRLWVQSALTTVPAAGQAAVNMLLTFPDLLQADSGLLIEYLASTILPNDGQGRLTITDLEMAFVSTSASPQQIVMELATPIQTLNNPRNPGGGSIQRTGGTSLFFPLPPLLTARDLDAMDQLRQGNVVPSRVFNVAPQLVLVISMGNTDAVNPHAFTASFGCMYRLVRNLRDA